MSLYIFVFIRQNNRQSEIKIMSSLKPGVSLLNQEARQLKAIIRAVLKQMFMKIENVRP
jgi:hypothetical protein